MEPIRIAHVIDVMNSGGIEAVVMNYYRNIDRTKIQFDFITSNTSSLPQRKEIESLGGRIFLTPRIKHLKLYKKELKKILTQNKYDIIHCHMGTLAVFPLKIAKKCGVKTRICHAHSTTSKKEWKRNIVKNILKPYSKKYATDYFACGKYAGKWLFGNKTFNDGLIYVMPNAIDIDKYKFNGNLRNEIRQKFNLQNKFVLGHIGRFVEQKNHGFLIDIFAEFLKNNPDSALLLIGEGPLEENVKNQVLKLGISENVRFLGVRKDCEKFYQAMDAFILPSLYEGLPVVGVEAQCSGLPCLFSDTVTDEIKINENVKLIPLQKEKWVSELKSLKNSKRCEITDFEMDIKIAAEKLTSKYYEFFNNNN